MKKSFLLYFSIALIAFSFIWGSCKKIHHDTYPTPADYRILSYNEIYTLQRNGATITLTDNYRFFYNGSNKVSQVLYTTNDSLGTNKSMAFEYSAGHIKRTVTALKTSLVMEVDDFAQDATGKITAATFKNSSFAYAYNGDLLYQMTETASDSGTTISATTTFTSDNKDHLLRSFDGNLTATFPQTGLRPIVVYPDTVFDTVLSLPLNVQWTLFSTLSPGVSHTGVNAYGDALSGYSTFPISVSAVDANGVIPRGHVLFPGGYWPKQYYDIHFDKPNRPGDYLQILSFSTYGVNIWNNEHLVWKIRNPGHTIEANYVIDANSKITQTNVVVTDSAGFKNTHQYNLQYEKF